jgi:hypothetical protein
MVSQSDRVTRSQTACPSGCGVLKTCYVQDDTDNNLWKRTKSTDADKVTNFENGTCMNPLTAMNNNRITRSQTKAAEAAKNKIANGVMCHRLVKKDGDNNTVLVPVQQMYNADGTPRVDTDGQPAFEERPNATCSAIGHSCMFEDNDGALSYLSRYADDAKYKHNNILVGHCGSIAAFETAKAADKAKRVAQKGVDLAVDAAEKGKRAVTDTAKFAAGAAQHGAQVAGEALYKGKLAAEEGYSMVKGGLASGAARISSTVQGRRYINRNSLTRILQKTLTELADNKDDPELVISRIPSIINDIGYDEEASTNSTVSR